MSGDFKIGQASGARASTSVESEGLQPRVGNGTNINIEVKDKSIFQRTAFRLILGLLTLGISELLLAIDLNKKTKQVAKELRTEVTDTLRNNVRKYQFMPIDVIKSEITLTMTVKSLGSVDIHN